MNGKLLSSDSIRLIKGNNLVQIDITSIAKGILLMEITGQSGKVSSKVIY